MHSIRILRGPVPKHVSAVLSRGYLVANKEKYYKEAANQVIEEKPEGWDVAKNYQQIPGPKPFPLVGNVLRVLTGEIDLQNSLPMYTRLHQQYGDLCAIRKIIIPDMVLVYSPSEIEKMFRNEGVWPIREGFDSMKYYRHVMRKDTFKDTASLVNTHGEDWFNIRTKVNPIMMQPRVTHRYTSELNNISAEFIERIKYLASLNPNGEMPEDFGNEINKWAFESIGLIALDTRMGCLEKNPNTENDVMISHMLELFKMMMWLDFTPLGEYYRKFNLPLWRKYVKYQDYFTDMCLKLINEAEKRYKAKAHDGSLEVRSVFEKLLQIDKSVAIIMTLDMLTAGVDTTGKTTGAALYYLAKNPEIQQNLRKELLRVLPKPDTPLTKDMLNDLPYLKAVIKETGRMAPIAAAVVRKSTKDLVLNGYQIPKGTTLFAPTLYLSRQEEHYPKPNEFIPDRWLRTTSGDLSYKNSNPFVTLQFGFGPRSCIGKRFANLEMELIISKIVRNFQLEWRHPEMRFKQELLYATRDPLKIRMKAVTT